MNKRSSRYRRYATYRPRRRTVRLRRFLRTSLMLLAIGFGIFIGWHVVNKIAKPYIVGYCEGREIAQIKAEIAQEKRDNRSLNREIRYLGTEAGQTAEARKLGMVKEGEVALIVETSEQDPSHTREESGVEKDKKPFWQAAGAWVAGLFGGGKKEATAE